MRGYVLQQGHKVDQAHQQRHMMDRFARLKHRREYMIVR